MLTGDVVPELEKSGDGECDIARFFSCSQGSYDSNPRADKCRTSTDRDSGSGLACAAYRTADAEFIRAHQRAFTCIRLMQVGDNASRSSQRQRRVNALAET